MVILNKVKPTMKIQHPRKPHTLESYPGPPFPSSSLPFPLVSLIVSTLMSVPSS